MNSLLDIVCPCVPVRDWLELLWEWEWEDGRGQSTERIQVTSAEINTDDGGTNNDVDDAIPLLKESRENQEECVSPSVTTWASAGDSESPTLTGAREVELSSLRPPECIICMGEFDRDNPVMCTLCACGENRSLFHYPCLLLWLERKNSCPNCSSVLYYQEKDLF
ncbi:hypothetical protein B484DRAFT_455658 [Ochromonadaceae sp. CCMP2298]|nr:hypothetical protein B484DRAFT_455658 [Ochromonadaceae sp. CCMP2298]|mmetsp:Transcript_29985/g.66350  ORF Transcript_29985/g.66350 Transcript_29985/m.66350 type:complete len:165 (+) Transcript_29985:200-694(+)